VSKDVAIVASHNSMSIDTIAEAAPMRVKLGSPEVHPAAGSRHYWASSSISPTKPALCQRIVTLHITE
jgi:hypothetical protein